MQKGKHMEKLELKNGEQIEVQSGAIENSVKVLVESIDAFKELYSKLTDDNLSQISYLNEAGVLCAIYKDKTLSKAEIATETDEETGESKLITTLTFKDIDITAKKLKHLEETIDTLLINGLEVK